MPLLSRRHFLGASALLGARFRSGTATAPGLSLTGSDYARFTPLATGDLVASDPPLTWIHGPRSEMLRRATSDPAVSGGEASMLQHAVRLDKGDRSLVAIPVFPLRNFTVRDIYVKKGSALEPGSLDGRRVGLYSWAASGAVWYRHLVRYWGNEPKSMRWLVGGVDAPGHVASVVPLPAHVTNAPVNRSLADLLIASDIEALLCPIPPKSYHPVDGPIVRLVPDFRPVEQRYFRETGCYPPQHVIVLRKEVWEADPSVGRKLVSVFDECESRFQAGQHLFPYASPWLMAEIEETDLLMGADYHAHGLPKNRHALDVFCQSAYEDGLTQRRLSVDEYFAEFSKT